MFKLKRMIVKILFLHVVLITILVSTGCTSMLYNTEIGKQKILPYNTEIGRKKILQAQKNSLPIIISKISTNYPNSAGGVNFKINFKNISGKTIKYASFGATAYNNVNDEVGCEIAGKRFASVGGRITGPIEPSKIKSATWSNAWYNSTIKYAKISFINIEFMNGEILKYSDEKSIMQMIIPE